MTFLFLPTNSLFHDYFFINLFNIFFSIYMKMFKNLLAACYQEKEERLQKKTGERYENLSKEKKRKKEEYGCGRYKNLSEDEK